MPIDERRTAADAGVEVELEGGAPPHPWRSRHRLAMGLSPTPGPGMILIAAGAILGPQGLAVLPAPFLTSLGPAVSGVLAVLGVMAGLDLKLRRPRETRLVVSAAVEGTVTAVLVSAGFLAGRLLSGSSPVEWPLLILLGLSAVASAGPAEALTRAEALAMRLAELDDLLPQAASGVALIWLQGLLPAAATASLIGQAVGLALAIALAGRLLVADGETRVYSIGIVLLVAGAAAYRSQSALFFGFVCGLAWNAMGARVAEPIGRDLHDLTPPLLALLLVVAGAGIDLTADLVAVAAVYVVLRAAGKVVGASLIRRTLLPALPADIGRRLVSPGIIGVALALDARQTGSAIAGTATILMIVAAGSLGSELLSALVTRRADSP